MRNKLYNQSTKMTNRDAEQADGNYSDESVKLLEGIELIRARPTLFIDGMDVDGLHRLFQEGVDNAVDEFLAGHGNELQVEIEPGSGVLSIRDNGRGMPVGTNEQTGMPTPVFLMTKAFAGAKFDGKAYSSSGGIHGVGLKCINAFSEWVELFIAKGDDQVHSYRFDNGCYSGSVEGDVVSRFPAGGSGTFLRFLPKYEIFGGAGFNPERISARLEDASYLNPGLKCVFKERGDEKIYHNEMGVRGFLEARGCTDVFSVTGEENGVGLEFHMGSLPHGDTISISYANGIPTNEGGSHVAGAKSGMARAAGTYAGRKKLTKESDPAISFMDTGEGCFSVISVRMEAPPFSSQRKTRIVSGDVESAASVIVGRAFERWLEESPQRAKAAVERMLNAAKNREKLRAIRDKLRIISKSKKSGKPAELLSGGADSGELTIVVRDPRWRRLGMKGRDVLPVGFKNSAAPTRASLEKLLKNPDYFALVSALGAGVGEKEEAAEGGFLLEKCRYQKITIRCGGGRAGKLAGAWILLFMENHLPGLIESGRVFWCAGEDEPRQVGVNRSLRGEADISQSEETEAE